jgi:hypothetical protein
MSKTFPPISSYTLPCTFGSDESMNYFAVVIAYLRLVRAIILEQRYDELLTRKEEIYLKTNVKPDNVVCSLQVGVNKFYVMYVGVYCC